MSQRRKIISRLKEKIASGNPVIGAGAGTGLSAMAAERGGADLIILYNSGKYRMAGRGSLAGLLYYGNANDIVLEMGHEVLPVVKNIPVLAGICGTDPFMITDCLLDQLMAMGFSGIQNFPTVGLIDGMFRQNLEETGMSYKKEVDLVGEARKKDFLTTPYVFNVEDAGLMASAGADIIVAHMGLTVGSPKTGISGKSLDTCATLTEKIINTVKKISPHTIILCHGGPISHPDDFNYLYNKCSGLDGFFGASSIERYPTENAITKEVKRFASQRRTLPGERTTVPFYKSSVG